VTEMIRRTIANYVPYFRSKENQQGMQAQK
jgi:hypothetical protein